MTDLNVIRSYNRDGAYMLPNATGMGVIFPCGMVAWQRLDRNPDAPGPSPGVALFRDLAEVIAFFAPIGLILMAFPDLSSIAEEGIRIGLNE